jgi:SAM-dependent methyltransferase
MSFSADWLALRAPADDAARDRGLMIAAMAEARRRAGQGAPVILDLGCGTGATARVLGPHLPGARWRLVDGDADLLAQAVAATGGAGHCLDLGDLAGLPLAGAHLVTASALLDLMPRNWLESLAERLAAEGTGLYAALSYDGAMGWDPALPEDAAVTAAFNAHQRGDKGLGPALGPDAAQVAAEVLAAAGFAVRLADSPWDLCPDQAALQAELMDGIAAAAAEAGCAMAGQWRAARAVAGGRCRIGHLDLLALPPGAAIG